MTVLLTINYRASGAVVTLPFPNAVEARKELLSRAAEQRLERRGIGRIGALVNAKGDVKASYTIELEEEK